MSEISREDQQEGFDLRRRIGLGLDIEQFKSTPVGKYLEHRCATERAEALERIAYIDPTHTEAIRADQTIVRMADTFFTWLLEAEHDGEQAARQLESQDDTD